jgi:hypothetical protein
MSIKTDLENIMRAAMKSGDAVRKDTLRLALSAIKLAEVEAKKELDDEGVLAVLQKEVKSRRESIADAEKANRQDLVDAANAEIAVLEEYLPQQLSTEELKSIIGEVIAEQGAASVVDMGKVMGALMPRVQGRADGGQVSQFVREALQAN